MEKRRKKILLVDDEESLLEVLKFRFESWDYDIETVASGNEALEKMNSFIPDLVFLDYIMPGLTGFDVCKAIRNHSDTKLQNIPIILFTASAESGLEEEAKTAGANMVMRKPFDAKEVQEALIEYLR